MSMFRLIVLLHTIISTQILLHTNQPHHKVQYMQWKLTAISNILPTISHSHRFVPLHLQTSYLSRETAQKKRAGAWPNQKKVDFLHTNFYHTKIDNLLKCTYNFEQTMLNQYQILYKTVDTRLLPPIREYFLTKESVYKCLQPMAIFQPYIHCMVISYAQQGLSQPPSV